MEGNQPASSAERIQKPVQSHQSADPTGTTDSFEDCLHGRSPQTFVAARLVSTPRSATIRGQGSQHLRNLRLRPGSSTQSRKPLVQPRNRWRVQCWPPSSSTSTSPNKSWWTTLLLQGGDRRLIDYLRSDISYWSPALPLDRQTKSPKSRQPKMHEAVMDPTHSWLGMLNSSLRNRGSSK